MISSIVVQYEFKSIREKIMENGKTQLCACSFGMAFGILWGVSVFLLGLSAMWFGYGADLVTGLGKLYIGYKATVLGSFIGLVWGFVDLFVAAFIVALIYNKCSSGKCCMK